MISKKIIREPGSGKTKELMALAQADGAYFVCKNPEAMMVKAEAYGYSLTIISYTDYLTNPIYNTPNAYIDDIDELGEVMGFQFKGFGGNLV